MHLSNRLAAIRQLGSRNSAESEDLPSGRQRLSKLQSVATHLDCSLLPHSTQNAGLAIFAILEAL